MDTAVGPGPTFSSKSEGEHLKCSFSPATSVPAPGQSVASTTKSQLTRRFLLKCKVLWPEREVVDTSLMPPPLFSQMWGLHKLGTGSVESRAYSPGSDALSLCTLPSVCRNLLLRKPFSVGSVCRLLMDPCAHPSSSPLIKIRPFLFYPRFSVFY